MLFPVTSAFSDASAIASSLEARHPPLTAISVLQLGFFALHHRELIRQQALRSASDHTSLSVVLHDNACSATDKGRGGRSCHAIIDIDSHSHEGQDQVANKFAALHFVGINFRLLLVGVQLARSRARL